MGGCVGILLCASFGMVVVGYLGKWLRAIGGMSGNRAYVFLASFLSTFMLPVEASSCAVSTYHLQKPLMAIFLWRGWEWRIF